MLNQDIMRLVEKAFADDRGAVITRLSYLTEEQILYVLDAARLIAEEAEDYWEGWYSPTGPSTIGRLTESGGDR